MGDGVGDHGGGLVQAGTEGMFDVIVPGLSHKTDDGRVCRQERGELFVVFGTAVGAAGGPEGDQGCRLERELGTSSGEEIVVFGIGSGPATFDVGDAEIVE